MRNADARIIETFASKDYVELTPNEKIAFYNKEMIEDERIFSYKRYAEEIHSPTRIDLDSTFVKDSLPRCLDMPIRLAGETTYKLPCEWSILQPILEELTGIEHKHNPHWKNYYTYMTVDSSPVKVGTQQRHGGLHVDGFQGERIDPKTKITRNYVATTNGGTQFWNQKFIVADPKSFNVFQGFDLQIDGEPFIAQPDTFYFMDAFTVHESGFAEFNGERLFIRFTYDLKKFDRLGNTHNPNLEYKWNMIERNAHDLIHTPRLTDIIDSPYFPTGNYKK